jgi:hypothetical protein
MIKGILTILAFGLLIFIAYAFRDVLFGIGYH